MLQRHSCDVISCQFLHIQYRGHEHMLLKRPCQSLHSLFQGEGAGLKNIVHMYCLYCTKSALKRVKHARYTLVPAVQARLVIYLHNKVTTCLIAMEAGKFEVLYKENVRFPEGREHGVRERPKNYHNLALFGCQLREVEDERYFWSGN
jgi:hypothetical protein